MSALTPDPRLTPEEPGNRPGLSAELAKATSRARLALAWERSWPHLARLLTVFGLFLAVSWAGLWIALPLYGRIIGLIAFAGLVLAVLALARTWRWPSEAEALRRLDRGSGIAHRPATALSDNLTMQDPVARALWQTQRERTAAAIGTIKAGLPSPRLPLHDRRALRALVAVLMVATFVAAGNEYKSRIAAAFSLDGAFAGANVRLDAWVTPPAYTGRPPVILSAANNASLNATPAANDHAEGPPMPVPSGSILLVRASGGKLDVAITGALTELEASDKIPAGTDEKRFLIGGDGAARVRSPSGHPLWRFTAAGDRPPTIALAKDPERQTKGALLLSYKLEDDYGVSEARADFKLRNPAATAQEATAPAGTVLSEQSKELLRQQASRQARPLYDAPTFPLVLPNARTRNGVGQTVRDLSENPYAGAEVTLTLVAKDEAGNEGRSEAFEMRLPERLFSKPLARALIEQRRVLALDANKRSLVGSALEGFLIAPELFTPEAGIYLSLSSLQQQLARATTDDALRETVDNMWTLATLIEGGNTSDAEKALRAAQEALRQALERGATDEEIKALTDQLRAALDNFMRQLAEQLKNNPQQLARPLDPNTRTMRPQDLQNMIDRMERLSKNGDKDAARALLDQMQQMLDNLQMARPGQGGDDDMEQAFNELNDMIREQQQLRDKTFQQGQDSRRDRNRGQQGDQSAMNELQKSQKALRDRLNKLQKDLAQRGLGKPPGQRGEKGDQGDPGDGDDSGLDDADSAMGDADGQLGEGNPDGAVGSQGKALDAMRKGAQQLAEAMQQGQGQGQAEGDGDPNGDNPGNRMGRRQRAGAATDPLGRPMRNDGTRDQFTTDNVPKEIDAQRARRILDELRRRLGEVARPQIELDYLERLLKDF